MVSLINSTISYYNHVLNERSDPRMKNWFLMDSPVPCLILSGLYLLFVLKIGPTFMKDRKPFELRKTIIAYNAFQSIFSLYMFLYGGIFGWFGNYNLVCQPLDTSMSEQQRKMLFASYLFHISKYTEFADTVFFILRKKFNQVTTLHVVHHGIVPFLTWMGAKFVPAGHYTFAGMLNTGIHVIMYTYYMLAAMGPEVRKYLWWKKYLTTMQLIQFVWVLLHTIGTLVFNCDVPKQFTVVLLFQGVLFFNLFWNFYKEEYNKKKRRESLKNQSKLSNGVKTEINGNVDVNDDILRKRRKQF